MLKHRILTALILIPLFILLLFKLPPIGFCLFTGVIVAWGALEWSFFMGIGKFPQCLIYPVIVVFLLITLVQLPLLPILYAAVAWWLVALILVIRYPKWSTAWSKSKLLRGVMGVLVLIPCWSALNFLRNVPAGPFILLFLFVLIWGADISAYFVGKKWGKHKLAPHVSPGKTWQGLAGALVSAVVISAAVLIALKLPSGAWLPVFILTIVTVLFSVLGDLVESMLKRNAGLKDSGHLLPGHGGILDRIDSLTAAAPIFVMGEIILSKFFQ